MSHLLTSSNKAIQRLHQFARIETVALTKVDKQAAIAFLCLILQFLLVALGLLLLLVRYDSLNLRRFGVVGQELTEL